MTTISCIYKHIVKFWNNEIYNLLQNLIKQRKDSIEQFQKAKRGDLIKNEQSEIDIINI